MMISLTYFADSHDRQGRQFTAPWADICARIVHKIGEKDGPAIACATFNGPRGNANLVQRSAIALDVETSRDGEVPPSFEFTVNGLKTRRVRSFCWTTHSHTPEAPRYRVLLPLPVSLPYDREIDVALSAALASDLALYSVCDRSKFGAASLFYLPRHREGSEFAAVAIEGSPVNVGKLQTSALNIAQRVEASAAEAAARRAANALPAELQALIEQYNATHPLIDRLPAYGYHRDGQRWRSRYQHGQGATVILPEGTGWVSFSETDAAEGVGRRPARSSSQCACFGDAFSLYVHYEHYGSFRAALESLQCP